MIYAAVNEAIYVNYSLNDINLTSSFDSHIVDYQKIQLLASLNEKPSLRRVPAKDDRHVFRSIIESRGKLTNDFVNYIENNYTTYQVQYCLADLSQTC